MNTMDVSLKERINTHYELSKQLNSEYNTVYSDMVVYLRTSLLKETDVEDLVNDILVMMLEGQARGATVESVFGKDYKHFCDDMITSTGRGSSWNQLKEHAHMLLPSMNITLFFSWIISLDIKKVTDYDSITTVNLSIAFILNMIFMWAGVFVVFWWIHTSTYDKKIKKLPPLGSAMVGGLVFTVLVFGMALVSRAMDDYVLMQFHLGWLFGLMVLLWVFEKAIKRIH